MITALEKFPIHYKITYSLQNPNIQIIKQWTNTKPNSHPDLIRPKPIIKHKKGWVPEKDSINHIAFHYQPTKKKKKTDILYTHQKPLKTR